MDQENAEVIILRLKEVKRRTGLATSTIYHMMNAGTFPRNKKLGERSVGWRSSDIENWISLKMGGSPDVR